MTFQDKRLVITFGVVLALLISGVALPPVTAQGVTIQVPVGGDLQAAINSAKPGDTIVLEAGAEYVCPGTCRLPNKTGEGTITIKSSRYEEIGARLGREPSAEQRQKMARVRSSAQADVPGMVFEARPGSHDYALLGLDIAPAAGRATVIVQLGTHGVDQDTPDEIPMRFKVDRSWIHGAVDQEVQRGIGLNSGATDITNNWITDIHGKGYDTQAIGGYNGPGPYKIINNYLEGAGENVMFGGAEATVPNLVPSDIEFRQNEVVKPLSWYVNDPSYAGIHWTVKNLFELKNARRVVVEGNIFDGNWTDAQAGRAIAFTPRPSDSGKWAVIEDVLFRHNIVRNVGSGIHFLGADEAPAPTETRLRRIRATNNLFININGPRFGSNGAFATVVHKTEDVMIDHNTVVYQTQHIIVTDYEPNTRFTYTANITRHNDFGIFGSGVGIGNPAIAKYFPGGDVTANVIAKEINTPSNAESLYPTGNFFPASLSTVLGSDHRVIDSAYAGLGCDIDALNAALSGTGTPVPQPTPSPEPTPTQPTEPVKTPSADGTKGSMIVDSELATWTISAQPEFKTLRNGTQVGGGQGSIYKYVTKTVYVLGLDSNWYQWVGSSWSGVGPNEPGAVQPAPEPTPTTPTPTPIEEYKIESFNGTEASRTALSQRMWATGFAYWSETDPDTKGNKIKFRRFR